MVRLAVFLLFCVVCAPLAHASRVYSIDHMSNGFFNYDKEKGVVIFSEQYHARGPDGKYGAGGASTYMINLNTRIILGESSAGENSSICIERMPMRSPNGRFIASLGFTKKKLKILDLRTNECNEIEPDFGFTDYSWSFDGAWLLFKDVSSRTFLRFDPRELTYKRYNNNNNFAYTVMWSPELETTLYVFLPSGLIDADPYSYTSNDFNYFYVNSRDEWVRFEGAFPLKSPQKDIHYREHSDIEQLPTTEFFDIKTGEMLTKQENFFLAAHNKYAVWLDNDWVYFQGAQGILNYRSGDFVSFDTENNSVVPFSVSEGRYAIMYHQKEDRLKVYDLEIRKYIEAYEPFWRESKQ